MPLSTEIRERCQRYSPKHRNSQLKFSAHPHPFQNRPSKVHEIPLKTTEWLSRASEANLSPAPRQPQWVSEGFRRTRFPAGHSPADAAQFAPPAGCSISPSLWAPSWEGGGPSSWWQAVEGLVPLRRMVAAAGERLGSGRPAARRFGSAAAAASAAARRAPPRTHRPPRSSTPLKAGSGSRGKEATGNAAVATGRDGFSHAPGEWGKPSRACKRARDRRSGHPPPWSHLLREGHRLTVSCRRGWKVNALGIPERGSSSFGSCVAYSPE